MARSRTSTKKKAKTKAKAKRTTTAAEEPGTPASATPRAASPAAAAWTSSTKGGYRVRAYQNPDAGSHEAPIKTTKGKDASLRCCCHCGK